MDCKKCNAMMGVREGDEPSEYCDSCAQDIAAIVSQFIRNTKIRSAETVYQCDRVIENAYVFIESLCNTAGYFSDDD